MGKKIGDYTLKEMKEICDTSPRRGWPYCREKCRFYDVCSVSPEEMTQEDLNKETEEDE